MQDDLPWTLITGGSKRIGAALSLTLAREGYPILIHYNHSHQEALETVQACRSAGVEADCIQGDFSSRESAQDFVARLMKFHPRIKNVVHNVGNYLIKPLLSTSVEEWVDLFQTNTHAPFIITRAIIASIKKERGSIINIGFAGINHIPADIHCPAYTATKLVLWMMTKSLAKELASDGVRVNMVSPGYTSCSVDMPDNAKSLPMGRPATLDEVSRAVAFLLDDKSSYITGQNVEVAGGIKLV